MTTLPFAVNNDLDAMRELMKTGWVQFVYAKKDGSIRIAEGTLCLSEVPGDLQPKGLRSPSPEVFTYYDLEKEGWRCFRREMIMGFIEK